MFSHLSGNRQPFSGRNDESIDEQGISAGSIPDSPIQLGGVGQGKGSFDSNTGNVLFVVVNCSPSRQPEDKRLAPQLECCVKCWRYQLHPIN